MPGLSRGVGQVEGGIAKSVKRKKISGLEGEKFMSSLIGTIDYDRFKEVHISHTFYFRGFVDLAIFLSLLSSHVVYML